MDKKKVYIAKKSVTKKGIVLPLCFGYGLKIALVRIQKKLSWPFKKYWQFMTFILLLIALVSSSMFLKNYEESVVYN